MRGAGGKGYAFYQIAVHNTEARLKTHLSEGLELSEL